MGFKLLLNENIKIKKGESNISLIGVENWGKGRFKKKGDIDKACIGLNKRDFKIVLNSFSDMKYFLLHSSIVKGLLEWIFIKMGFESLQARSP